MNKYISSKIAKHLLIAGGVIILVSLVISIITTSQIYSYAGDSTSSSSKILVDLKYWKSVVKFNYAFVAIGYLLVLLGFIDLIISKLRSKQ